MNPSQFSDFRRRDQGFSLIELMIAVAIVGILLGIAVPTYRDHLRRGAVEEATGALASGRVAVEQFFLDNRSYVDVNGVTPCPASTQHFTLACVGDATTYTLTATGTDMVDGFVYTITETDARHTDSPWGTGNCWIARKGDSC
jgi:type IV pilus assembly protein PilE